MINIHTHKRTLANTVEIVSTNNINDEGFYSIGIHPWYIKNIEIDYSQIELMAKATNVLAIGEIGLDRAIKTDIEIQKNVFIKQLQIAKKVNKPIIIHCVRAYSDIQEIIKKHPYKYIFHGFNANKIIAENLISKGVFLSFGYELIQNKNLQNTFKQLPINKIFFETDESDVNIKDIYKFASELLNIKFEALEKQIQNNFNKIIS